jgi:hypothetical protein
LFTKTLKQEFIMSNSDTKPITQQRRHRLRRLETRFLRAEKHALIALSALAGGLVTTGTLDTLKASHVQMVDLLPAFEAETGKMLDTKSLLRLEKAMDLIAKTKKSDKEKIAKAIPRATKSLILTHNSLTKMLPNWFKPLVQGGPKQESGPTNPAH